VVRAHDSRVNKSAETSAAAGEPGDNAPDDAARDNRSCAASLADALVDVAGAYLSGKIAAAGNPDIYQVIVHVGPEALLPAPPPAAAPAPVSDVSAETPASPGDPAQSPARQPAPAPDPTCRYPGHPAHPARCHLDDGPALSPAAAQAIACHATITTMLHDHHGDVLDVGRRHRKPSPALRRAVRERDEGRCQFPGCNSRRTDIHHSTPWAKGGKTRMKDLILVCEAHHVIIHAHGYLITTVADGSFTFIRPDGQPLPSAPDLPGSDGDLTRCHDADITTDTIIPIGLADNLDLDLAIWAAFANTRIDREARQHQHEDNFDLAA
jgi:hypothetical protein